MNEIRQLCTTPASPVQHLDEILALFHACPPQHLLPSLSLIGQSISCMSIEQLDLPILNHPIFVLIRQWSERLFQIWLNNSTLNGDEYRAIFYLHQLFKLLSEWLIEQENRSLKTRNDQSVDELMKKLFLEENFLSTLARVIDQLMQNETDKPFNDLVSIRIFEELTMEYYIKDDDDQVSPDDIQLRTQTSDIQAEHDDVLDVLYRCINSLVILYSHRSLITNTIVEENLTPSILNCLNNPLFVQLSLEFLRQNVTRDKINIRSIFFLFTCLDYSTLSTIAFGLLPSINHIFHIWCELPKKSDEEISLLIVCLIRFLNQFAFEEKESIIRENICTYLLPHFDLLCQTSNVINDLTSLLVSIGSTTIGKQYLRQLGFVPYILYEVKRHAQLWHPLGLLITQQDLYEASFLKRLIHLLILRTTSIFQSLTTASNDTSFDSISPSSRQQLAMTAMEWFGLFRTHFLSFSVIVDELINSTKKVHLVNMLIDTILSLEQDEDIQPKFIEVMMELLWTFAFSSSTNIHEILQKQTELCRWLKLNVNDSMSSIRLPSQAILSMLDLNSKISARTTLNRRSSLPTNILICLLNADESYHELCITLRDRLQIEQHYSVELIVTPTCQSIDSLMYLINRSSICLFCSSRRMKYDNLSHFISYYLSLQSYPIHSLAVVLEHDLEFDGNWLENISIVDIPSILKEIRRYLNPQTTLPRQMNSQKFDHSTQNYMQRSVCYWSSEDVSQWCEAAQGHFESLRPLMTRLNGPALVHLAEILSIEPASMYHSLNDELLQRTGTTVPLTEYVSLRSELQQLFVDKQNQCMTMSSMELHSKRRKWRNSRFCTVL